MADDPGRIPRHRQPQRCPRRRPLPGHRRLGLDALPAGLLDAVPARGGGSGRRSPGPRPWPPAATRTAGSRRGHRLRLEDVTGDACAHVVVFNALEPWERLNVADTQKIPWQAYLGDGHPLLSGDGRVLATVVGDTSGHHDAFCGTSTDAWNQREVRRRRPAGSRPRRGARC